MTPGMTPETPENAPQPASWWIATGRLRDGGEKFLGPFATQDLAMEVRRYVELVNAPVTYWVVPEGPSTT